MEALEKRPLPQAMRNRGTIPTVAIKKNKKNRRKESFFRMIKLATADYLYPHSVLSDQAALFSDSEATAVFVLEGLASFTLMLQ